ITWMVLRAIDTLIPHSTSDVLSYHLVAPHRWFEDGIQVLDPLHPNEALASVWEALYFHLNAISHSFGAIHRTVLVRLHLSAQLLHYTARQVLALLILANLITAFVRSGWDILTHVSGGKTLQRARTIA